MNDQIPMHSALEPLKWLVGTWRTEKPASGHFPTIEPFEYCEEINFSSIGQPMLNYTAQSWHPVKKCPMHREVGFLKITPKTNDVSLLLTHNFGLCTVEEGCVTDHEIVLKSTSISRKTGPYKAPAVLEIKREFKLVGDALHHTLHMATEKTTELTPHLEAVYKKQ
ncbi:THAP domain-containing protein 4-like isoform X2 [Copidosoma floridanum]|nr:THAP domain-containing protein 4-like isoform X2 [Copidosoma floridanum]XP_014212485.1 THAP domain-containing protein 4-like isoform X2 [Copidosoma floridanum]